MTTATLDTAPRHPRKPFHKRLYGQVLLAIVVGVLVGRFFPDIGVVMKPLGDVFIKLIRMMIAPIVFVTVVTGIAKMSSMRDVGRIGLKALIYFEVVSTLALIVGLVVGNIVRPGDGLNVDPQSLNASLVSSYVGSGEKLHFVDFIMKMVPETFVSALTSGDVLQVLLVSVVFGLVLVRTGRSDGAIVRMLDEVAEALFGVIEVIMYFAPLGAFGAMAFTIGKYGIGSLQQLGLLMLCFYATCALFIFGVLGAIARLSGFSLWRLLVYIRREIVLVLGTSTSESALPSLMTKLENLGVSKSVVGLVVPTGYSFNLDGIAIYLTMAALFIAQAMNIPLPLEQQLALLAVLLLTSKGAAAVTGAGFVTLAATLSSTHTLPVAGLALLLGIDRFMSEARAITNMIGNAVACMTVARWENAIDRERMAAVLAGREVDDLPAAADSALPPPVAAPAATQLAGRAG
ncbi:C4-dicarboxylate transporter DctA [Bradyrhizobium sp. U87765 SZCCT0131]|uniref:C4-dicarboxylate transporter DctA n=1 Tax=unclassified Bradyrhizobium TaxID=2631580 RepID=UPI001BA9196B|nr:MULTISPECIES: C4-dicarboxylate transporter DctA [unclassified Bradyrhizobium]MBR1222361.1 C4-dicarboxylate transporter DctA [Bradyrhizobium sp. U87765 SZCCT0131]MBR1264155.1 C4-dicarboxylate transporter DctA [Bradyrhizobium sp. U87765 SZCCT0134]MBR1308062.1 C4-dicarboxylate transporter DctA [Bradyrhizobium sp. U87765 SZCCT0110]MBR1320405.1 C4-dicarboxylate transporter DctA [Bradyrhizobium sp. U87765 SZCCT0109]MBR1348482.1 C4-dicarboxylate transporter DctA [Bradyrhizobium sp. U87765 SZCCT004